MKRLLFLSVLLILFNSLIVAQDIPVNDHNNFSGITATLKELVKRNGKSKLNTFYISNIKKDKSREFTYAYWKQDKSVIILQLPLNEKTANYYWLYSKARIDLLTDVVPTQEDIGGSTFLVDRTWINSVLRRCSKGYKLSILKPNK